MTQTYKYQHLQRLFPSLYEVVWRFLLKLTNLNFCIRYINYVRLRTPVDRETKWEYSEVEHKLKENMLSGSLEYPLNYAVSNLAGLVQYAIIRRTRPNTVVETGVANGYSTYVILSALNKNKHGKLISVEISRNVGGPLRGIDISRWILVVGKPRKNLATALKGIKKVEIFIHDGDHSYKNMMFEFDQAYKKMSHGIIMSDDVNWSICSTKSALIDFANKVKKQPMLFPTTSKTFGVIELD